MVSAFVVDLNLAVQSVPGVYAITVRRAPPRLALAGHAYLAFEKSARGRRRQIDSDRRPVISGPRRDSGSRRGVWRSQRTIVGTSMGISPDSIRRVGESDLLELAQVARSTWQNWIRAGILGNMHDGLYDEEAVVELIVVAIMLGALDVRQAAVAWRPARHVVLEQALMLPIDESEPCFLAVIDLHTWQMKTATTADQVRSAVQAQVPFPRGRLVFDLGSSVTEARRSFWSRAQPAADLLKDRRRKRRSAIAPTRRTRNTR